MVADVLLMKLNAQGMYAQEYADDIAIFFRCKHINICLELIRRLCPLWKDCVMGRV